MKTVQVHLIKHSWDIGKNLSKSFSTGVNIIQQCQRRSPSSLSLD